MEPPPCVASIDMRRKELVSGRIYSTSHSTSTADRGSSTVRHELTTQHEFHLVVNPAGHEGIGRDNSYQRCPNTVRCQTAGMTPEAAATGKASTSKHVVF